MLFLFVYRSISVPAFNYIYHPLEEILYFEMKTFEKFEVVLNKYTYIFFSDWSQIDDLYLDISSENSEGKVEEYDTFTSASHLIGLCFKKRNVTIKVLYEGIEQIQFALLFNYSLQYIIPDITFPIKKYDLEKFDLDNDPFIYDSGAQKSNAIFFTISIFFVIYVSCFWFHCCCFKCSKSYLYSESSSL